MIERIARRAGGFASTTALRWLGAARDSAPEIELPSIRQPSAGQRLRKPLTRGALTSAVVLISSNRTVRSGVARGLLKVSEAVRTDGSKAGTQSGRSSTNGSSTARSNGNGNGNGNGTTIGSLSKKTRTELYELAKKKDIPGRSNMSKQELAKALSQT